MHTLSCVVNDAVGSDRVDDHEDETVHDLVDRVEQQPRGADDEHVTVHHRAAKGDGAVLGDHGRDDVGATGAAVVGEDRTQSQATQHGTQDDIHECLLLYNRGGEHGLQHADEEGGDGCADNGA